MKVLVTGAAGFIGMYVSRLLLQRGDEVVGIDNLNDYYSPALKQARIEQLQPFSRFGFETIDIADSAAMASLFARHGFDAVVHLAAQAGVRYSLKNPLAYAHSNLLGFTNVIENCRQYPLRHLVYASSSSVYGNNPKVPFSEDDRVDHPVSFYAATKKANELMAHSYSHLYGLATTGLRFFTVYGEWGRPDMAPWLFTEAISQNKAIKVFNHGQLERDFTYIDDIVEGITRTLQHPPSKTPTPYALYNIGNHTPVPLMTFIETIESALGKTAEKIYLPMQEGDVPRTYADTERLQAAIGFNPSTSLTEGIARFVAWYRAYHRTK